MNTAALHPVAKQLIATLHKLAGQGVLSSIRYSASVRDGDVIWLTPAEVRPDALQPHQLILQWPNGQLMVDEPLRPCSAWPLHARLYEACPEIGVLLVTHPADVLANFRQENTVQSKTRGRLPAFEPIPYLPHETGFDEIAATLQKQPVVLCEEHGLLVSGLKLTNALNALEDSLLLARSFR